MRPLALVLACGLLVAGCGEEKPVRTSATPKVTLKLAAPNDGLLLRDDSVQVSGTVSPADSTVQVAGEQADVSGGEFTAEVPLDPGANIIDISASSPGRRPATGALRVRRDMRVPVPQLVGLEFGEAVDKLRAAGLEAREQQGGNWLDRVIPGTDHVCSVQPGQGTLVERETTVTVLTQRNC